MNETAFQLALADLEDLSRSQRDVEDREEWSSSLDRLQEEEAALSRLLEAAEPALVVGRKPLTDEIGGRLDALIASYGDRIARIELHKRQNRRELSSLGQKREFAVSALHLYSQGGSVGRSMLPASEKWDNCRSD